MSFYYLPYTDMKLTNSVEISVSCRLVFKVIAKQHVGVGVVSVLCENAQYSSTRNWREEEKGTLGIVEKQVAMKKWKNLEGLDKYLDLTFSIL